MLWYNKRVTEDTINPSFLNKKVPVTLLYIVYNMTVTIKLQNSDGNLIATFPWEDKQSISQIAENNGIDIPVSCGIGVCGVCKCKIVSWNQYTQIDKISMPMRPLERDNDGNFQEVFACVGWISSEAIKDIDNHEIILEKNM